MHIGDLLPIMMFGAYVFFLKYSRTPDNFISLYLERYLRKQGQKSRRSVFLVSLLCVIIGLLMFFLASTYIPDFFKDVHEVQRDRGREINILYSGWALVLKYLTFGLASLETFRLIRRAGKKVNERG